MFSTVVHHRDQQKRRIAVYTHQYILLSFFFGQSHFISQAGLELTVLLPQALKYWDYVLFAFATICC